MNGMAAPRFLGLWVWEAVIKHGAPSHTYFPSALMDDDETVERKCAGERFSPNYPSVIIFELEGM